MKKKVIRLTESDLMRLVKRIIRESDDWSDEDESELSSISGKYDQLKKSTMDKAMTARSKYTKDDGDVDWDSYTDELNSIYDEPEYKSVRDRKDDLSMRKSKYKEKMRYDDVIKNRPSDFDVDKYSSEYDELGSEIEGLKKGYPYLKDEPDVDTFIDKFNKYDKSDKGMSLKSKQDRRAYLGKHLDRDYTHPSWKNRK